MDIPYLINILQNKLNYLKNAETAAVAVGDMNSVTSINQDILTTQNTLAQLQLLQSVTQAAATANASAADLLDNAIASVQVQGPSASAVINGYDISAYATDVLYEQKINNILSLMPVFTNASDLTSYIQNIAPNSPLSGEMIFSAAGSYSVDIPLMTAIMQLDSVFGTQGVGSNTNNPGNIGNTGTSTQTFPSWNDGVNAVAEWLSRHRVNSSVVIPDDMNTSTTTSTITQDEQVVSPNASSTDQTINPDVETETETETVTVTSPDTSASTTPPVTPSTETVSTDTSSTTPEVLPVEQPIQPSATSTDTTASSTEETNGPVSFRLMKSRKKLII